MEKRQKPTGKAMRPKEGRFWYHVRWIAINLVLIAISAFLYAEYLIPRFVGGNDTPAVPAPDHVKPAAPLQPLPARTRAPAGDSKSRLPSADEASPHASARPRIYYSPDVMKREGLRCVGGIAFNVREVKGVTTVENYRSGSDLIRCRP